MPKKGLQYTHKRPTSPRQGEYAFTQQEIFAIQTYVDCNGHLAEARMLLGMDEGQWVELTDRICRKIQVGWTVEAAFFMLRNGLVTL